MEQAIVRNVPGKGYDIIKSSKNWPKVIDIFTLLPEVITSNPPLSPHFRYFSKNWLFSPLKRYLIKFVSPDFDEFGRCSMKTHTLLLKKYEYLAKGLPFYLSPLLEDKIDSDRNDLLEDRDFNPFPIHLTAQKLLESVFTDKVVMVKGRLYLQDAIARQFSFIDYAIPDVINHTFSIHSYLGEGQNDLQKNFNLNFTLDPKESSETMDWLIETSSSPIIQELCRNIDNPTARKRIHEKLINTNLNNKPFTFDFKQFQ